MIVEEHKHNRRIFTYNKRLCNLWDDLVSGEITREIEDGLRNIGIFGVHSSERGSWDSWLNWFRYNKGALEMLDKNLGVLIEFSISASRHRVDFIISGLKNGKHASVIIEMKGWKKVRNSKNFDVVKTIVGEYDEMLHPSIQANTYKESIVHNYVSDKFGDINISSCVLMHNNDLSDESKQALMNPGKFESCLKKSPIFFSDDVDALVSYIKEYIFEPSKKENEWYKNSRICYSPKRIEEFKNNITLLDEFAKNFGLGPSQKITFKYILDNIEKPQKNIFIVTGDPGSGKTIVAVKILNELLMNGRTSRLILPGTDFREGFINLLKKHGLKHIKEHIQAGIINKNSMNKLQDFDSLIIDEFHKLFDSASFGDMMMEDYFKIGKNHIIFLDESQVVDVRSGLVKNNFFGEVIERLQKTYGFIVHYNKKHLQLSEQYRHSGMIDYPAWIDNVLGLSPFYSKSFKISRENSNNSFKIQIISDSNEFIESYHKETKNNIDNLSIRLLSTYFFNWTKEFIELFEEEPKAVNEYFAKDITIGKYSFAWKPSVLNFTNKKHGKEYCDFSKIKKKVSKKIKDIGGDDFINNNKFGEQFVGYYNTVQGSEFDVVYVIVGRDLIIKDDGEMVLNEEWRSRKETKRDFLFVLKESNKPEKYTIKEKFDINTKLLKRQLKVLMTRGRSKVVLHFLDKNMEEHFRKHLV